MRVANKIREIWEFFAPLKLQKMYSDTITY